MPKRKKRREPAKSPRGGAPHTLAIDIGGTHLKASVLDRAGREIVPRVEAATPHPAPPAAVVPLLVELVQALPRYDRVSVGFPGVVSRGRIITAPNLDTAHWRGFPLAGELAKRLRRPVRVLNDAEVQGLGVIEGRGLECVLTLGTGLGSALYRDGELMPHLELGQHPIRKGKTYDQYVGSAALARKGDAKWNRRVLRMIGVVRTLLNFDRLYLGGGDAARLRLELPADVTIVSNEAGITGGIRLWDPALDRFFPPVDRRAARTSRSARTG
ncbi:MAG TPA: ROK family protein [Casimicrobiaceae bacterium]|nr:ROK family protein [Casimicrobiaceae bacterium]